MNEWERERSCVRALWMIGNPEHSSTSTDIQHNSQSTQTHGINCRVEADVDYRGEINDEFLFSSWTIILTTFSRTRIRMWTRIRRYKQNRIHPLPKRETRDEHLYWLYLPLLEATRKMTKQSTQCPVCFKTMELTQSFHHQTRDQESVRMRTRAEKVWEMGRETFWRWGRRRWDRRRMKRWDGKWMKGKRKRSEERDKMAPSFVDNFQLKVVISDLSGKRVCMAGSECTGIYWRTKMTHYTTYRFILFCVSCAQNKTEAVKGSIWQVGGVRMTASNYCHRSSEEDPMSRVLLELW